MGVLDETLVFDPSPEAENGTTYFCLFFLKGDPITFQLNQGLVTPEAWGPL
jgi:hypothetical protein